MSEFIPPSVASVPQVQPVTEEHGLNPWMIVALVMVGIHVLVLMFAFTIFRSRAEFVSLLRLIGQRLTYHGKETGDMEMGILPRSSNPVEDEPLSYTATVAPPDVFVIGDSEDEEEHHEQHREEPRVDLRDPRSRFSRYYDGDDANMYARLEKRKILITQIKASKPPGFKLKPPLYTMKDIEAFREACAEPQPSFSEPSFSKPFPADVTKEQ